MIKRAEDEQREAVARHQASLLKGDEQLIRAAVLDVIDEGSYELYEADYFNGRTVREDEAKNERLNFTDAIIARIKQLKHGLRQEIAAAKGKVLADDVLRQMDDAAEANHPR